MKKALLSEDKSALKTKKEHIERGGFNRYEGDIRRQPHPTPDIHSIVIIALICRERNTYFPTFEKNHSGRALRSVCEVKVNTTTWGVLNSRKEGRGDRASEARPEVV